MRIPSQRNDSYLTALMVTVTHMVAWLDSRNRDQRGQQWPIEMAFTVFVVNLHRPLEKFSSLSDFDWLTATPLGMDVLTHELGLPQLHPTSVSNLLLTVHIQNHWQPGFITKTTPSSRWFITELITSDFFFCCCWFQLFILLSRCKWAHEKELCFEFGLFKSYVKITHKDGDQLASHFKNNFSMVCRRSSSSTSTTLSFRLFVMFGTGGGGDGGVIVGAGTIVDIWQCFGCRDAMAKI